MNQYKKFANNLSELLENHRHTLGFEGETDHLKDYLLDAINQFNKLNNKLINYHRSNEINNPELFSDIQYLFSIKGTKYGVKIEEFMVEVDDKNNAVIKLFEDYGLNYDTGYEVDFIELAQKHQLQSLNFEFQVNRKY